MLELSSLTSSYTSLQVPVWPPLLLLPRAPLALPLLELQHAPHQQPPQAPAQAPAQPLAQPQPRLPPQRQWLSMRPQVTRRAGEAMRL